MKFSHDHRLLFGSVCALFLALTLVIAIVPAQQSQTLYAPLPGSEPLSEDAWAGKHLFIANGCVACHTQQVRNVAMDRPWGARPSIGADYADIRRTDFWRNTATLMGTERTGPDLTSIGSRQPSVAWQLLHLYNPRAVVPGSIMPGYPWLFEEKAEAGPADVVVNVPAAFRRGPGQVVAKREAQQLVAYLLALKQTPLPDGTPPPEFMYEREPTAPTGDTASPLLDGAALYASHCQACHQPNGAGLPGTFPPLQGSPIVIDDNPQRLVTIIMRGYNSREREGYPAMPAIGEVNQLRAAEIHAIVNHERSHWGNQARPVPLEEIEQILQSLSP